MISPWIFTTRMCNMRCDYCFVRGTDIMEKRIYDAMSIRFCNQDVHMRIAGGEPLLVYNRWKDWCRQWKRVEVLTNFRVIPDGYFKLPVRTSVSIDGYGEKILDKEMIKNLSRLRVQPWIMTTIYQIGDLPMLAYFIAKNKYGWSISTDYKGLGNYSQESLLMAMAEVINVLKGMSYDFHNFNFNNLDFYGERGGCTAGDSMFAVDTDGSIYSCQSCHRGLDKYFLGNVWDGYETKPCAKKHTVCQDCSIRSVCTQWCPVYFNPKEQNDLCQVMKFVVKEVLYAK